MDLIGTLLAVVLVAVLISAIFYYGLKSRGPWGSFWSFFLVLLLIIWAASLWVRPIGPVFWGVAWMPLFFIGILFALLLAAIPTSTPDRRNRIKTTSTNVDNRTSAEENAAAVGGLFWVFMVILLFAVIFGYIF